MNFKTEIKKSKYQSEFRKNKLWDPLLIEKIKEETAVIKAAELLKKGELVALPTETVYGLAADALNQKAVRKIFKAKGRPQDNPLIVHIAEKKQLQRLVKKIPAKAEKLINKFWPGPLTIIFSKKKVVPAQTSAGLDTIAVRMPAHPLILAVIEKSGLNLAAPSANTSGFPSPTQAQHVYHDLKGKIPLILDGGPCYFGVESTVVDIRGENLRVLRPGGITREELADFLGEEIRLHSSKIAEEEKALSPGMKYRHYAPEKKLFIFNFEDKYSVLKRALQKAAKIKKPAAKEGKKKEKKIAIITARESEIFLSDSLKDRVKLLPVFSRDKPEEMAKKLFSLLRELDADQMVAEIYIEELAAEGIGEAVMNRISKAAAAADDFQPGGGDN